MQLQLGVDVEGVCKAKVGHLHLDQSFFRFYETKIPAINVQVTLVALTHALVHKTTITTTKQNKIKPIKKEEGTET